MNDEQKEMIDLLTKAIAATYGEERPLLQCSEGEERIGMEQAFAFRTGVYLSSLLVDTRFKSFDLDSEYNKNHGDSKRTKNFPKGLRPDLILHKRHSNDENKLVVQFKGYWNATEKAMNDDLAKLHDFTSLDDDYKYALGVFVLLNKVKPAFRFSTDGKECGEVSDE